MACLSLLTLHLKHCGDGSVFSNGNSSFFFFICCVEHLSCPGMLTDTAAANPPGQPDPALVLSLVLGKVLGHGHLEAWTQAGSVEQTLV